jgi:hypothetical protein
LKQARDAGVLGAGKDARITGRVSSVLVEAAKARAGISSETGLIELALATLALDDDFGARLVGLNGSVAAEVDLEF